MSDQNIVFVGLWASAKSLKELSVRRGFLVVENGKISKKGTSNEFETLKKSGSFSKFKIVHLNDSQFIMPGFVDCHTHAPQFPNIGLGLDRPLLEWLAKYTFPLESRYGDLEFASSVYDKVVQRLITNGTTTACYFGSLHLDGTLELAKSAIKHRQRALIGKVSMNLENDAGYYNDTAKEVHEVEDFVKKILEFKNELIQPVVTPRFAVSCDLELLASLADIAKRYDCRIQSHISENLSEIDYVLQQFPSCKSYGDVYDKSNILNNKCIMAHAVYLTDDEIKLLSTRGVSVAHCPASNTRLKSGLCPVRKYLDSDITVGLGTDVAGGDNATILDAMRRSMDVSTHLELKGNENYSLDWTAAFYLATLGGAKALGLDSKIGSLDEGKDFDALLIDVYANNSAIDNHETYGSAGDRDLGLLQRFVYLGDDRNIVQVYVKGNKIKDIL
ncbi:guanine deaminase [Amyelois transitella]|uniref:guanine deaminase n=1 Tax=Amyelois transitella TaxID=680683 RepID=UPI0029903997|nr:guanine deaminase [Amyelois transitella]